MTLRLRPDTASREAELRAAGSRPGNRDNRLPVSSAGPGYRMPRPDRAGNHPRNARQFAMPRPERSGQGYEYDVAALRTGNLNLRRPRPRQDKKPREWRESRPSDPFDRKCRLVLSHQSEDQVSCLSTNHKHLKSMWKAARARACFHPDCRKTRQLSLHLEGRAPRGSAPPLRVPLASAHVVD